MWAIIINIILGVWVVVSPSLLGNSPATAENNYIVGPLIITFSIISLWDINRVVRYCNVPIGIWLAVAAFVLPTDQWSEWSNIFSGLFVALLPFVPAPSSQKFGGGWKSLFDKQAAHLSYPDD